jgi:hypothetical protein
MTNEIVKKQEVIDIDSDDFRDNLNRKEDNFTFPISDKDYKNLKKSKYFQVKDKYDKSFVIQNKKTGVIAEIRAITEVHACSLIGWRIKNTNFIDVLKA